MYIFKVVYFAYPVVMLGALCFLTTWCVTNDTPEKQMMLLHATKDMEQRVEDSRTTYIVEGDDKLTVSQGDYTVSIVKGKLVLQSEGELNIETNGILSMKGKKVMINE